MEEVFIDAALVRGLTPLSEVVFNRVPQDEDQNHQGNSRGEIVLDRREAC